MSGKLVALLVIGGCLLGLGALVALGHFSSRWVVYPSRLAILALVALLACVTPLIVALAWIGRRRLGILAETWSALARRTGLLAIPGVRIGHPPNLEGEYRGRHILVSEITREVGWGDHSGNAAFTQVSLQVRSRSGYRLSVEPMGFVAAIKPQDVVASGHDEFDRRFLVRGAPPDFIQRAVQRMVREQGIFLDPPRKIPWVAPAGSEVGQHALVSWSPPSIGLETLALTCLQRGMVLDVDRLIALWNLLSDLAELVEGADGLSEGADEPGAPAVTPRVALRPDSSDRRRTVTDLHWTELDGVTTIWTDAPTPFRAGLLFRTGQVDETLTTAGQTHLIEHMALSALGAPEGSTNGLVGPAATGFFTMGTPEDVSSFLASVCAALTSLPADRLEDEKQVLAAEIAARSYDLRGNLLMWRYGAAGYGLVGMAQLGIRGATLERLHEWAARRFTNGNALLWLSGPPPAGLRLKLPHGTKQPLPPLTPVQKTPSWFLDDACGGVAVGATVPRLFATTVYCEIASTRLLKQLRSVRAVSYAPSVFYDPLSADTAHLGFYADSDKDHRAELCAEFGEIFRRLGEIDSSEVEAARGQIRERLNGSLAPSPADRMVLEAQRAATDWVLGKEFESLESNATQLASVDANAVVGVNRDVHATAMFALPSGAAWQPCFGQRALISTVPPVQGHTTLSVDAPIRPERLVHGPDGVSMIWPDGTHCTVRYDELAAALPYDDGCVTLIGSDAATVAVEPTLWPDGQRLCRMIRERVPPHLLLDQLSRPLTSIPKPSTTAWQRFRARLTHG